VFKNCNKRRQALERLTGWPKPLKSQGIYKADFSGYKNPDPGGRVKVGADMERFRTYFKTSRIDENVPSFPLTLTLSPKGEREKNLIIS
jgi:hypothetical protein